MKRNILIILGLIIIIISALTLDACSNSKQSLEYQQTLNKKLQEEISKIPKTINVAYRISGTSKNVAVTYLNGTGGIVQQVIRNNQTIYLPNIQNGTQLNISAFSWEGVGSIKVEILVDGEVWKAARCDGSYGNINLSGYCFKN